MNRLISVLTILYLTGCTSQQAAVDSRAPNVDALLSKFNKPDIPGASVMVIREGKVLYRASYGLAHLEEKREATPSTNYRLASVTKQFTAMAVMILVERDALSYESTLTDMFPGFPAYGGRIKVRNLLQHTSGLIDYEDLIPEGTTIPVLDRDVLDLLKEQDSTYFDPGSRYQYSNSGYALLALIVEKVSGQSFASFLENNIFAPLGMGNTVAFEQGKSTVKNRAYGYTQRDTTDERSFEFTDQSLTSSVLGDGGIYSSIADLFKWDQTLYTNKLVSSSTLGQAFTPNILPNGQNSGYGFGWRIALHHGLRTLHHSGSTIGFRTHILRFPDERFTVIVLVNRANVNTEALAFAIADLYLSPN